MTTVNDIRRAAMQLPAEEKARLAEELLSSLDTSEQIEIDAEWTEEIERRIDEVDSGKVKTIPADQVFRELEERK